MEYVCVQARFLFYNGQKQYTVEYGYGVSTWYVFEDEKKEDALWWKKINPATSKTPNRGKAEEILYEYFETVKTH